MSKLSLIFRIASATPLLALLACSPASTPPVETTEPAAETAPSDNQAAGQLTIRANGEDFVRQGFVTKDDWQVTFDHVYVTLAEVTAYQSDPPFDAEAGGKPQATETISVGEPTTVDLAEGGDDAEPVLITTVDAPAGRYNALSWQMQPAAAGPAAGQTIWLEGTAAKADETIAFIVKLDPTLQFVCGDFVGDNRKGILEAADQADLEATFHFDHLFGDGETAPDDDINTGALGFEPLAAIATDGSLEVDMAGLEAQLAPEDYATLINILPSLGHVGEGHCEETTLTNS
ncbi:MAG: DUF4382 domain-containing protein [Cyanobacteria bacterium P01_D01_bin.115]